MALKPTGAGAQAELATLSEGELLAVVRAQPRPEHVAIIMDGNGRWATRRGLPRVAGHREGVKTARAIVRAADTLGLRYLTLYAFSTENWSRPEDEVSTLLSLLERAIRSELPELMERNVRLRVLGRKNGVRSEEHTSELQSLGISYAVFCLKKKATYFASYLTGGDCEPADQN